jgi:hypothetical protein
MRGAGSRQGREGMCVLHLVPAKSVHPGNCRMRALGDLGSRNGWTEGGLGAAPVRGAAQVGGRKALILAATKSMATAVCSSGRL